MNFVAYWSRVRLRVTWRSSLALVVLVGLTGGTVLALVAGGLRTDSAYPRFNAQYLGADASLYESDTPVQARQAFREVAQLPQVAASGELQGYSTATGGTFGAPLGPGYGHTLERSRTLSGRMPSAPDEEAIDWTTADTHHLQVGDTDREVLIGNVPGPDGSLPQVAVTMRVVGVVARPLNFPPYADGQSAAIVVSPSFFEKYRSVLGGPQLALQVRLTHGPADFPAFSRGVVRLFPDQAVVVSASGPQTQSIENAIRPAAVALWLLGGSLAVVGGFILFQLLGRLSAVEEDLYATATALGTTRRQLQGVELARTLAVAVSAAALATVVAIGLSPIFPLGTAGVAEPDPGVAVDGWVLGVGLLLIVLLTAGLAVWPGWRTTRDASRPRSWRAQRAVARAGRAWSPAWLWLRPVAWVGVVHGLRPGRGASAVPIRASVTSLIIAVTGLTGALTFGASLNHLIDTPALYGWNWDAHIYDQGSTGTEVLTHRLDADPWLADVAASDTGLPLLVDGHQVSALDLEQHKGAVTPVMADGQVPTHPDQIALALTTMHQLGVQIGARVRVSITAVDGPTRTYTVVGTAVVPAVDNQESTSGGAVLSRAAILRMAPGVTNIPPTSDEFVNFASGAMTPSHLAQLQRQIGSEYRVDLAEPPTDVLNFGRVQNLPLLLAFLLAGLAAATLVLTLISSAHRRRGDLAVLKALGYRPRQLRAVVACQSTAMAVVGLAVGIPVGIALGRWLWVLVADHLGTVPETVIPGWELAVMAAGVLALAVAVSIWPGRMAARTPVSTALYVTGAG